jgi:hypothetical protein
MTKEEIITARNFNLADMLEAGFTFDELIETGDIQLAYYAPSESEEYFDGENFYNASGQLLRDPSEYDTNSEGYTPFGDE